MSTLGQKPVQVVKFQNVSDFQTIFENLPHRESLEQIILGGTVFKGLI